MLTQDRNPLSESGNCFCQSSGLRVHRQTHTGGEKPYSCRKCRGGLFSEVTPHHASDSTRRGKPCEQRECGKPLSRRHRSPPIRRQTEHNRRLCWVEKTNLCNSSSHKRNLMNTITMETIAATIFTHRLSIIRKESSRNSLGRNLYRVPPLHHRISMRWQKPKNLQNTREASPPEVYSNESYTGEKFHH